jgi:hypothetical protein
MERPVTRALLARALRPEAAGCESASAAAGQEPAEDEAFPLLDLPGPCLWAVLCGLWREPADVAAVACASRATAALCDDLLLWRHLLQARYGPDALPGVPGEGAVRARVCCGARRQTAPRGKATTPFHARLRPHCCTPTATHTPTPSQHNKLKNADNRALPASGTGGLGVFPGAGCQLCRRRPQHCGHRSAQNLGCAGAGVHCCRCGVAVCVLCARVRVPVCQPRCTTCIPAAAPACGQHTPPPLNAHTQFPAHNTTNTNTTNTTNTTRV